MLQADPRAAPVALLVDVSPSEQGVCFTARSET
jgi:hypothetical protein